MASATYTPVINPFPNGHDLHQNKIGLLGTATFSAGTYSAGGVPYASALTGVYENQLPIWAEVLSPTSGYLYRMNPATGAIRIFGAGSPPPPVTTAAFAIQAAGFGATGSIASITSNSNQSAFSLTVTGAGGTYGTNPTIVYTFPVPYTAPPVVVVSRGNDAAVQTNAGYWVVVDASTTAYACTFEFVGTPTAANYVLDAFVVDVGTNPSAPVVVGSFAASSGWGASAAVTLINAGSTQNAFSINIHANGSCTSAPTVTLTFPVPYATAPIFVCSDGVARPTAGKWTFVSSTTTTATFCWAATPTTTDDYVLDAVCLNPSAPLITASAFAASSGFGTAPVLTVTGNQNAYQLTIVAKATCAANPTITVTLPATLVAVPVYVPSRADVDTGTQFWASEDASNTTAAAIFKFVGTPTAGHTYGLSVVSQLPGGGYNELAVGGTIPPQVLSDVLYFYTIGNYS